MRPNCMTLYHTVLLCFELRFDRCGWISEMQKLPWSFVIMVSLQLANDLLYCDLLRVKFIECAI